MTRPIRIFACAWLAAMALPFAAVAQNAPPTSPAGRTAPPGTAVAPPKSATEDGGRRPPVDPTGQTAPTGTPVAPSGLTNPSTATPSPPSTTTRP